MYDTDENKKTSIFFLPLKTLIDIKLSYRWLPVYTVL